MDLIVLGAVLWDLFPDEKLIGGAPFNVAAHATRLGMRTAFVSAVGADNLGAQALARAAQLGLSTQYIRTVQDRPTGTVRVFLKDGQPDYDIIRPAAYDCPDLNAADLRRLAETAPQWLYFGTLEQLSPEAMKVLARLLTAIPAARRFYDLNLRKNSYRSELVERLLNDATILKINESEAAAIAEMLDMHGVDCESFCNAVATRFDLECVCITRGQRGCAIWRHDLFVESPGCSVALADAVGAGDAFSAALMHGLTASWDLRRVAAFANRLGALVASRRGAVPQWTLEDIMERKEA